MSNLHPNDDSAPRTNEPAFERFEYCRRMLYLHGFLSERESEKVKARINKWCAAALAAAKGKV